MTRESLYGNSINSYYSLIEIAHLPISLRLRRIGIDKITLSKNYFIIEFYGNSIFIINYTKYDDIYHKTSSKLSQLSENTYHFDIEIEPAILEFMEEESQTIKKIIKNFRSWNR